MAIYLEIPKLEAEFPFRILLNEGDILTTPHWHKEIEIILITSGIVNLGVSDRPIQAKAGDIIIIGSGEIHYVLASAQSERLVFQFDFSFFQELTVLKNTQESLYEVFASCKNCSVDWTADVHQKMKALLMEIQKEYEAKNEGYSYAVKGYMSLLMTMLYREIPRKSKHDRAQMEMNSNHTLEKMDQIFRYIEAHYHHEIRLDDIAEEIGFSACYFAKFFKKNTGKTFTTFLNEYRIEKAKWILLNEDVSSNELIERTGFGSAKTFYRVFKMYTKKSPNAYKKAHIVKVH